MSDRLIQRLVRHASQLALAITSAGLIVMLASQPAQALKAAGLTGKTPTGGTTIQSFVDTIQTNALWFFGTISVLCILAVGGLYFVGDENASRYGRKLIGATVIIIAATAIAA